MTLNYLMECGVLLGNLWNVEYPWGFVEYGVPLHSHYSQAYSDHEWYHLIWSNLCLIELFDNLTERKKMTDV